MDEEQVKISIGLFVQALGYMFEENEGIIIHLDDKGYVVWKNPENETIEVMADDEYLQFESGRRTWIHYEGSTAPLPEECDEFLGDMPTIPKTMKN